MRPILVWFRADFRLHDNPALAAAAASGQPVIPVYVHDDDTPGDWRMGGAARWWLHQSLAGLSADLRRIGSRLIIRRGPAVEVLTGIAQTTKASGIALSRGYEPWSSSLERALKQALSGDGVDVKRYAGSLLFEPDEIRTKTGQPYKVYTPFWRAVCATATVRQPLPAPKKLSAPSAWPPSDSLALRPTTPDWSAGLAAAWTPGEAGARARLDAFIAGPLGGYAEARNRPDLPATSRLSPHLKHGEISPATCWHAAILAAERTPALKPGLETFLKELVWREFSYHLLFNWPDLPHAPFRPEFAAFPWNETKTELKAWQSGQTGYPIVDAGMRELWQTGWMHNRVRMIVASFLVKNLMQSWQAGEAWFWDTLVDADLASNAASWQWVAGSGADAAPYFRIFNPVTQGEKFDPDGTYVRRYVPELARLPTRFIQSPWTAPAESLQAAGIVLGRTYPHPIVDLAATRVRALAAFATLKVAKADARTA
jgi:deoxyribodipyrimidine photo-lyase